MSLEFHPDKKPEVKIVDEKVFYPGKLSVDGFLASGEKLNEVIARDRATCERLGVTPKQIGEAIEKILKENEGDLFDVSRETWRGMQECPFDKSLTPFSNQDFIITNKQTGESFGGPGLIIHLLKEHSFFEGNTKYRVEPENVIRVLFGKT